MNIKVIQLERKADHNGVITAHWICTKQDQDYTASSYGAESFQPDPESPDFIPFEDLTESDVIDWLMAKEDWADNLEATLDANIEQQVNPPILQGLPWHSDETE